MQTANQRLALGRYSHVRMVPVPDWLPVRRSPRSASGRAKALGLSYERATIAAISLAFENKQAISQLESSLFVLNFTDFSSNLENATVALQSSICQTQITHPELIAGQWIEYKKNNTNHLCQPDLLIIFWPKRNLPTNHLDSIGSGNVHLAPSGKVSSGNFLDKTDGGTSRPSLIICCEIKLTYTPTAIKKLNRLYLPLVDSIFHPQILLPLIICKNLTTLAPIHSFSLSSVLSLPTPLLYFPSGNFRI